MKRRGYVYTWLVTTTGEKVTIPRGFRKDMAKVLELEERRRERPEAIIPLFQAYEQIIERLPTNAYPAFCAVLQLDMANVYRDLPTGDRTGNLKQAIAYYQQAIAYSQQETSRSRSARRAYALLQNDLGAAYLALPTGDRTTNLKQAIEYFQEASRSWTSKPSRSWNPMFSRSLTPPQNHYYALAQNNLGRAYLHLPTGDRLANLKEAKTCFLQALIIWTLAYPLFYAMVQHNLGAYEAAVYLNPLPPPLDRRFYLEAAIGYFQKALRIRTPEVAPFQCLETNRDLAHLYFTQDEWQAALDAYLAAINAGEQLYRAGLSSESKTAETAVTADIYRHAAFAAARCGHATQALLILEQGKTRLLAEALHLQVRRPAAVPDEVWAAFEDARALIRTEVFENRSTDMPNEKGDLIEVYRAHEQTVRSARIALDASIERIRIYDKGFLRSINLATIQDQLPDERTVFVAFCITDKGCISLVVRKCDDVQGVEVPNFTQTELRRLFSDWLEGYNRYRGERSTAALEATITKVLAALGERLLAPILSTLSADIERIVFLPSAELFLFPLHAAPLSDNNSKLVCDRYQVSYAPSVEVLADISTRAIQVATPDLYAVINPQADPQLFFTPIAGAAIARLFSECDVDEGRVGTRENVIARAHGRAYVLFCCHGGYDWDDPTQSGLMLADKRLTLADLQNGEANLSNTRLVTLAACEVGITDVLKGSAEEYVGVPAGFMLAGVPCIVSGLWAVLDISTALLMERFYANHLKGELDFVAALHEAQLWLRELKVGEVAAYAEQCYQQSAQKNKSILYRLKRYYRYQAEHNPSLHPFEHPYYWAAFTVNGRPDVQSPTLALAVGEKDRAVLIEHLEGDGQSRGSESRQEQAGQPMAVLFSPSRTAPSPNKARKGTSLYELIGPLLISLVLLVIGGSIGRFIIEGNVGRLIYVLAPSVAAQATATAQANAAATATAEINAENPDPYPPKNGELMLYDPLSSPSNWQNSSHQFSSGGTCQFIDGAYHAQETQSNSISPCVDLNSQFNNFAFEVQMKISKGDCGGMSFRHNPYQGSIYVYLVCQDGAYFLELSTPSGSKNLTRHYSSAFVKGFNQSNLIAIVANGATISLYINHQKVDTVIDYTLNSGYIGLIAGNLGNPTEVIYTYAKVWTL